MNMNTDCQVPYVDPIELPPLSDEAAVEIQNFIEHVFDLFGRHYGAQVSRYYDDRAEHNMVQPTLHVAADKDDPPF